MKIKRLDIRSLRFRLWIYFGLFAMILLATIWLLQVFFLNNYYEEMKVNETSGIAKSIETQYVNGDFQKLRDSIYEMRKQNDLTIQIEDDEGNIQYSPTTRYYESLVQSDVKSSTNKESLNYPNLYQEKIEEVKALLIEKKTNSITIETVDPVTELDALAYASYLEKSEDNNIYLFIFSPLYPVQSTVDILTNQLTYVTIICVLIAFMVAFYISSRVTNPIMKITESAEDLAEGKYGTIFDGGQYSEINKLADTLTYTSLELAKAENMQKDLIANVSHDLRTPLTMVISYAEMIRDLSGDDPEKRKEHLQIIIDEAERLNQMVSDLLEVSKMHQGKENMHLTDFPLKNVIESILQSYTAFAEQEGYKLIFISEGEGVIRADETRIQQVLTNLVSNAFKYSGKDKTIEVKMLDSGDFVRCEVSDHGIGIPKKDLKHVWERYYKASSNRRRTENTGLGLSIVKEILILHNAKFGVNSALRKGSTFWFEMKKSSVYSEDTNTDPVQHLPGRATASKDSKSSRDKDNKGEVSDE